MADLPDDLRARAERGRRGLTGEDETTGRLGDLARDIANAPHIPEHEIEHAVTAGRFRLHGSLDKLLTPAMVRVLLCASRGLGTKESAVTLGVSTETVKSELAQARYVLGSKTTTHACCEAIRQGLIP